MQKGKFEAFL